MDEMIWAPLASRLLKCPLDDQLFDSSIGLRLHLCESHAERICRHNRVPRQVALQEIEIPEKLFLCGHCGFIVPAAEHGDSGMVRHIRAAHPNPFGAIQVKFSVSTDSTLIEQFVEAEMSHEVCSCSYSECAQVFSDEPSVALHWAEEHCSAPSIEETRRAFEADPDRFRRPLAECLSEIAEEEIRRCLSAPAPDDGYVIRHSPNVPKIRSKPGEHIIYVEREPVRFLDRELEELLEYEGLDLIEDVPRGGVWPQADHQTVHVDLRFCNILDGYFPMVKDVRHILPPLADGETIDVVWQSESFPCKVSRSKRAIYNLDGQLKRIFSQLPSGVRLYITRVGPLRYQLEVKRAPHMVRDCKFFLADGHGGWAVEFRDEMVEWETGDHVFRHQLTFEHLEALHHEARRTNLSIKDAVYEAMRQLASETAVHVLDVHDFVFLWMRTCSLAAVWAQFRPEHKCYVRALPGWYRFDPTASLPTVRFVPPPLRPRIRLRQYSKDGTRYRVKQRGWRHNIYNSRLEQFQDDPDALLDVRCAFGTPDEVVFVIPIPWLMEQIIPRADCNERGQYLFSVNQHDFVFTWDHGIKMDGRSFMEER
ncbi:MAG: hypothetical protein Q7S40_19640 [Opitutaceae bacterium]|nr:hypothetical protein [Opitutaceae bacterium]